MLNILMKCKLGATNLCHQSTLLNVIYLFDLHLLIRFFKIIILILDILFSIYKARTKEEIGLTESNLYFQR